MVIEFPPFQLDVSGWQLRRDGKPVPLRPKTFTFLQYLAERPGELVTKRALLDAVWPGVAVTEDVLRLSARELRAVLGDQTTAPRFIETVPRLGYRFIATMGRAAVAGPAPGDVDDDRPTDGLVVGRGDERGQSLRLSLLGTVALLTCGALMAACATESKPAVCVDNTPHTIRFVTVAPGVELEVVDWGGSGAPMVLLTGSGDNAHVYDEFAFQFTNYFHVIGITRRGWLPSSQPPDGYDVPTRTADDIAVLDALGIDKAVFVGHSAAGMELIQLGQAYGARVDKLVFLDAADLAQRFLPSRREPPSAEYTDADLKSLWAFQAATARYQAIREPNPSVCLRLQFDANGAIVDSSTPASILDKFNAGFSAVPPADWASIKAPRLGIFAEFTIKARQPWYWYLSDARKKEFNRAWRPIVAWHRRTIRKFAKRNSANTVRLPGAPHYVYIQNEAEVVRSMREFLGIPLSFS